MPKEFVVRSQDKFVTPEQYEAAQRGEGSHVGMGISQCPVTGHLWTNTVLLAKKYMPGRELKPVKPIHKYEFIGQEPLPEVVEMFEEGYIALIEIDPDKSTTGANGRMSLEDAHRTGVLAWLKQDMARHVLQVPEDQELSQIAFISPDMTKQIGDIAKAAGIHPDQVAAEEG